MTIEDQHAQTSHRYRSDEPCRAPSSAPRYAAPARPCSPTERIPSRPRRWAAAVAALIDLQQEYRIWLDNLPQSLEESRLADKLQTIVELDLQELQAIDPPLGYGRD